MNATTDLTSARTTHQSADAESVRLRKKNKQTWKHEKKVKWFENKTDDRFAYHVWQNDFRCTSGHRFQTPRSSGSFQRVEALWRSASALAATCPAEDKWLGSCAATRPAQQHECRRGCCHGCLISCFSKEASGEPGPLQSQDRDGKFQGR